MSRKKRPEFILNDYYHILNRGNNKIKIFLEDEDKQYFCNKLMDLTLEHCLYIDSFCLMNNHFHLELLCTDGFDISKIIQSLCTSYAIYYNKKYNKIGHVFQDRFKAKRIFSIQGMINVRNYIKNNPVKKGYVEEPIQYPWLWSRDMRPWMITRGTVPAGDSPSLP